MDARTTLPLPDTCDTAPRAEFLRGLRAAVPVMIGFIPFALVLLRGMWQGMKAARPWLVSLAVAAATYLLVPGAWYVASGALAGLAAAWLLAEDAA